MATALLILFGSAIVGLATGLLFRIWALLLVSPAIAILAAVVLQISGFGFWTGIPIIIGSLISCQLAYMLAAFHLHKGKSLAQDDIDGGPGQHRQEGIGKYDE